MAFDGDIVQIKVFSSVHEHASKAVTEVESNVNAYLSNYPAALVHSIQAETRDFVDPKWDIDGPELVTRYTVTVVLKA